MLREIVKRIFQKLDDPNYKCENELCRKLRGNIKIEEDKNLDKNTINNQVHKSNKEHQENSKELYKTANKETPKNKLPINEQNNTNSDSRPVIKNFKYDPNNDNPNESNKTMKIESVKNPKQNDQKNKKNANSRSSNKLIKMNDSNNKQGIKSKESYNSRPLIKNLKYDPNKEHQDDSKVSNKTQKEESNKQNTTSSTSKHVTINEKNEERSEKKNIVSSNNQSVCICTCSPAENYYRRCGCSYVYHAGRILWIGCPSDFSN